MIKLLKGNQSGVALLTVLFIVVVLSIVGTFMLQSTTYGLQTVVKNNKDQEEFYRAEGAIEIVLAEMSEYKTSNGNSGPFFYALDHDIVTHTIGNREVEVQITTNPDVETITPSPTRPVNEPITVTLEARYKDNSTVSRVMTFDMALFPDTIITNHGFSYVNDDGYKNKGQFLINPKPEQVHVDTYYDLMEDLGIGWSTTTNGNSNNITGIVWSTTYDYQLIDQSFIFPSGIKKVKEIKVQGEGNKIIIPNDAIVFAETVTLGGNAGANAGIPQLIIEGALIVNEYKNNGNSIVTINSGMVTYNNSGTSNTFQVNGLTRGIDCLLLPAACSPDDGTEVLTGTYSSRLSPKSIDFSTER
ncbi:hypothetical protein JOC85_003124 [Bacillus mesophilus]|uniref:Type 4 fimbrial biogenesis protein PilX N-terminal domain-containing protein n=1 Tax=Bacillus mesophilus TaxID=1808955 RepID=A0A6M0Q9S5_9BACI|nr:pilus assembly PilX N-terminal domain-containing protein [Bacillus mesophilus]MBM7662317.1 hypothetical protein [Bacillus mesophilus]NEY73053.1 hypothetical protein [Bacillus mesophilus]